jgi:hypothetical protein
LRLAVALGAIALTGAVVWAPLPKGSSIGVLVLIALFATLVAVHARVIVRMERASAALRFHERGIARLAGQWHTEGADARDAGTAFSTPNHPYLGDLDIFGKASLFQLLDQTETRFGAAYLASWLKGATGIFPGDVNRRQEAVKDLAPRLAFRERLSAEGALLGADKPDPEPFLAWADGKTPLAVNPVVKVLAKILPVFTLGAIFAYAFLPTGVWAGLVVLQILLGTPTRARVAEIAASVSSKERALARYADMLAAIENEKFDSALLGDRHGVLLASGKSATREMAALGRILGFLDARNNEVFRIFIGPVLMWDLNCAIALEAWRLHAGKNVRAWLSALAEIEALSSLAGFAFDRPDHAFPELSASPCLVATALAHPMIPANKRIANDLELDGPGRALVITGSNMSGKSTLLRAVGANAVLALAGAPVCATKMSIGDIRVVTSMRVTDSLEEGVSHFYAELQKLKMVCDMARGERTVLFLLDEILHGTNTRERLIGARAIVRELVKRGAMGAVSTHDLAIGDLETELAGKVKNFHFQEQVVNDKMTFDYKLRPGVVQSSNALRLMKIVGLDIDVEV